MPELTPTTPLQAATSGDHEGEHKALSMPTIGGIEGKGRVILVSEPGRLPRFVGALTIALEDWRRAVELMKSDDPAKYIGPVRDKHGVKAMRLNVRITKVHTPSTIGARIDFVSTGAPEQT